MRHLPSIISVSVATVVVLSTCNYILTELFYTIDPDIFKLPVEQFMDKVQIFIILGVKLRRLYIYILNERYLHANVFYLIITTQVNIGASSYVQINVNLCTQSS